MVDLSEKASTAEKILVMQAYVDGKIIQCARAEADSSKWWVPVSPSWNWTVYKYRIKPELLEKWVIVYGDGSWGSVYATKEEAEEDAYIDEAMRVALMREVTDE